MKAKHIAIGIGAIVAVAAIWFGRVAWRAHLGLVTLHVRNAPLAEVIRKIERQTWEKVRVDQKLDARVTLDVKNMPLPNVLDLLAKQAGARWGKTYAVYESDGALRRLESVFHGDAKLDEAGWTNLAPQFSASGSPDPAVPEGRADPAQTMTVSSDDPNHSSVQIFRTPEEAEKFQESLRDKGFTVTPGKNGFTAMRKGSGSNNATMTTFSGPNGNVVMTSPGGAAGFQQGRKGPDGKMKGMAQRTVVRSGPGGITRTTATTDGDGVVKVIKTSPDGAIEDQWSSERLVMETALSARLGDAIPTQATPAAAARTAATLRSRYTTYYALEKSPWGMAGMGRLPLHGPSPEEIEREIKQEKLDGLGGTPEEQVQRARQMEGAKQSP